MQDIITFYHYEEIQGKLVKSLETGVIEYKFEGGFLIRSSKFPLTKCIAIENVISYQ